MAALLAEEAGVPDALAHSCLGWVLDTAPIHVKGVLTARLHVSALQDMGPCLVLPEPSH